MFKYISRGVYCSFYITKYFCPMIHIGKLIKRVVKERGMTITEFGKRISTHRRNVYDIFERESVDTALLQKVSDILEHDFFGYYKQARSKEIRLLNESSKEYKRADKNNQDYEQLLEKLEICRKEIEYLGQLIKEKDKIISLLEKKK